jgi:thioredoxin 1
VDTASGQEPETMSEITHADDQTFDAEVLQATVPVVVDFWAPWCGPCHMVAPELEALAAAHGDAVKVVKLNVDEAPGVAGRYGIAGIPTVALFRDGEPVAASVGAKPRHAIEADLGLPSSPAASSPAAS